MPSCYASPTQTLLPKSSFRSNRNPPGVGPECAWNAVSIGLRWLFCWSQVGVTARTSEAPVTAVLCSPSQSHLSLASHWPRGGERCALSFQMSDSLLAEASLGSLTSSWHAACEDPHWAGVLSYSSLERLSQAQRGGGFPTAALLCLSS